MIQEGSNIIRLQNRGEVGQDRRDWTHFRDRLEVDVAKVRIGEHDVGRESAEYYVAELDAPLRDDIAEGEVILAQEFGEVVEEDEQETEGSSVQISGGWLEVGTFHEG